MNPMAMSMTFSGVRLTSLLSWATCLAALAATSCCCALLETAPDMSLKPARGNGVREWDRVDVIKMEGGDVTKVEKQ